ncbi:hypothetical protein AVEN_151498-1 [Araneus ventricosus]|uniref:Uncharacterized protein n=1 Tax=Araneus ventricosus TaxID=182803 RepID=A0A4Y2V703_ARAVE|nr:hypothetical protein AVEN_151498-1 [Araneus ventricosus]
MTPSLKIPGRLSRMASQWPSDYFLLTKLEENLSGTRFCSDSDVKTAAEDWLDGQGLYFYQAGLNNNTSVFADFGYRRSFGFGFCRLSRISSAYPRDLAANFAETEGEGANSNKYEVEKFVSEPKDYVEAEGFLLQ